MSIYYDDDSVTLHHGDALEIAQTLTTGSVDCIVTSPPYYGLRDYGELRQYGLEATPADYVQTMRDVFSELRRVLADDGTLWINVGDSYNSAPTGNFNGGGKLLSGRKLDGYIGSGTFDKFKASGLPPKNLIGIPWMVAFSLQADGWHLRNEVIWHKSTSMPDSARDRFSRKHEHLFMLSKRANYFFDLESVHNENGANPGDVWTIAPTPFAGAHFATMPVTLAEKCVRAGCRPGGTVLDPFSGSGTTGLAATRYGRRYVGIDLNAKYLDLSLRTRLQEPTLDFGSAS